MTDAYPTSYESLAALYPVGELDLYSNQPYDTGILHKSGDHHLATRLLVTLKSSSQLLLVGPRNSGKLALLESVAHMLVGDPEHQYQVMVGHAYWASRSRNISLLVEAQSSLNKQKLLLLLEEAARPENVDRLFMACLARISPAEVINIFSGSGLQLFSGEEPIPYPPNFRLIGTLDSPGFRLWMPGLLTNTSIVEWPKMELVSINGSQNSHLSSRAAKTDFLKGCVRTEQEAYSRLIRLFGKKRPFPLLAQTNALLSENGVELTSDATNKAVVFLANAWTGEGEGLFTSPTEANLNIALRYAVTQYILPSARISGWDDSHLFNRMIRLLQPYGFE